MDAISEQRVAGLLPHVAEKARALIQRCEAMGIVLRITSGFRSAAYQDALYEQGRSRPGRVVTHARGGQSWHNIGRAFDVVPMLDGLPVWSGNPATWATIGREGEALGLEWGGRFRAVDMPHFQLRDGLTLDQARLQTYQYR